MYAIGTPHSSDLSHYDSAARESEAADRKWQQDKDTLIAAVQAGAMNVLLPMPYGGRPRSVATYITEPSVIPAEKLLEAVQHAMAGRDHIASEMLRDFVALCGEDYAEDASE